MNFLFFSKLLPLFLYPLGFTCLLLAIALFLSLRRKRSRWLPLPIFLALLVLWLSGNAWTTNYLVKSLEWQNLPPTEIPTADAIVLLGGATRSPEEPRQMPEVLEAGDRVIYAAKLYKDNKAPTIVISGGRIEWKGGGAPESTDIARLLEFMGVPTDAIVEEPDSLNTYENAVNVSKILQQKKIDRVLLVTSAIHMPRSLLIFKHQGIEAIPAPTDFLISKQELSELGSTNEGRILYLLPDTEKLHQTTQALKEYIGLLVYRLKGWL
ncbi:MAG: YdcF family protein [Xenococcaceae cyanobacterium]